MVKTKIKPLLPSLRDKKRYLAYEVISKYKFQDPLQLNKAISGAANEFLGSFGAANAGILPIDNKWDKDLQKGIIKVSNKHLDMLKSSLIFIKQVDGKEAIIRSLGASGILRKTQQKYLNEAS
jgi:ribonuclease P/MRP protein subunit POP5